MAREWTSTRPQRLWREYSDRLQIALLDRWLPDLPRRADGTRPTVLKTDLFDEVAGKGIVHRLEAGGYRTTGIDLSSVVVGEAGRRYPTIEVVAADVRSLPLPDDGFDVVFSGSTLDHFEASADIARALAELARVLRPSGRLILTMDNPTNPFVRIRNGPLLALLLRMGIVPYPVGATLGAGPLAAILRGLGLDVLETTAILHCPRVLAVAATRWVERRGDALGDRWLGMLSGWERLERLPSRFLTGHFTAILARKSPALGTARRPR